MAGACTQAGCTFAADGKCLDGVSPVGACQKLAANALKAAATPAATSASDGEAAFVRSHVGRTLAYTELGSLLSRRGSRQIVLAGPVAAGKTTLVASLYQHFALSVRDRYAFCASETLMGFEMRCHLARAKSNLDAESTAHTPSGDVEFLHLRIRENTSGVERDLIFSDVNGESFQDAGANQDDAAALDFMSTASRLVLVVDGSILVNGPRRFSAFHSQQSFLGMLVSAGRSNSFEAIDIVATKWDLTYNQLEVARIGSTLGTLATEVCRLMNRVVPVHTHVVAARPSADQVVERGHGFDGLLQQWMSETPRSSLSHAELSPAGHGSERYAAHARPQES